MPDETPAPEPVAAPEAPHHESPRRKRKQKLPTWTHPGLYVGARLGAAAINLMGPEPAMRVMRRLGELAVTLPKVRSRVDKAMENISWCFPTWERQTVREYAIESHRHLFCLAAELALTPRLWSRDGYATRIEFGEMSRAIRSMCDERPCILITGHTGNWELLGTTLAGLGFNMHALYRPLDITPLNDWLHEARSRHGIDLVDKFGAAEVLPRLLHAGEPVGFIADQNAGDRGIFVPFFNRLASAYKTIGLLAMQHEATVLCGHARRLSGLSAGTGDPTRSQAVRESQIFRYRIDIVDHFGPSEWRHHPDPLFYITARYRRAIEAMIRRAPEQNLWMHRYWKSRPPHERRGSAFPAQLREKIAALPWIDDDDVEQIVERSSLDARALHGAARPHRAARAGS